MIDDALWFTSSSHTMWHTVHRSWPYGHHNAVLLISLRICSWPFYCAYTQLIDNIMQKIPCGGYVDMTVCMTPSLGSSRLRHSVVLYRCSL